MTIIEKVTAKINLSLDVLRKRDNDKYHEVEMIMTTIDLADRIELTSLEENKIKVSLESRYVPNDERNLAYKAARVFKDEFNISKGVHIKIDKNIPVSAGLGGGSTNSAAVIRGLNRLWDLDLPLGTLGSVAARCGSDTSFSLYGNTAMAKGFGEIIEKLPSPPPCWVVLAKPNIGVSTRTIFERVNLAERIHPDTESIVEALYDKSFSKLCASIGNVLEAVTLKQYPEARRIKEKMVQHGVEWATRSGSGPTIFALIEHYSRARRMYNGLRGFCDDVYLVRTIG